MNFSVLQVLILLILLASPSFAQDWLKLVPIESTRTDVERLLGKPSESANSETNHLSSNQAIYNLKNERLTIDYGNEACESLGWKAPLDSVTSLNVIFQKKTTLANLNIDKRKYEKKPDLKNRDYYINLQKGINFYVETDSGRIISMTLFPKLKYSNLRCADSKEDINIRSPKTDEYYSLSINEEKEHLDWFASSLMVYQDSPGTTAYIIVYPAKGTQFAVAKTLAMRKKSYLVNKHGFNASSIKIIVGGYIEKTKTELWIRPNGWSPPAISPIR